MSAKIIRVESENNLFQHVEVLRRNRTKRQRYREFFVEGVQLIDRVLSCGWPIASLIYSTDRRLSDWAVETIERAPARQRLDMSLDLLRRLSEKPDPSEIVAVVDMPDDDLSRIPTGPSLLTVIFDRPSNHGNLGTIIRSCDAFRVDGLIALGHAVDLYDPRTVRSSIGSLFALPVVRAGSPHDLAPWIAGLRAQWADLQVVGSSAKAKHELDAADLTRPTILVIGNETVGMSAALHDMCQEIVRIPIYGSASSLNVAAATSILLYEVDRQRRTKPALPASPRGIVPPSGSRDHPAR